MAFTFISRHSSKHASEYIRQDSFVLFNGPSRSLVQVQPLMFMIETIFSIKLGSKNVKTFGALHPLNLSCASITDSYIVGMKPKMLIYNNLWARAGM